MDAVRVIVGLLVGVALLADVTHGQEVVRWHNDIEQARRIAAESNRLVLIHFVIRNCQPCAKLEANVFPDPRFVHALQASFVPVKLNADDFPMTAEKFGVTRFPTDVVLTSGGTVIAKTGCPQTADDYVTQLREIADYHRRTTERAMAAAASPSGASAAAPRRAEQHAGVSHSATTSPAPTSGATSTAARPATAAPANSLPYGRALEQNAAATRPQPADYQAQASAYRPPPSDYQAHATTSQPSMSSHPASGASFQPQISTVPSPAANSPPPLGLDGFCPVQLVEGQRWVPGDRKFGAVHRGRTYLFNGPQEQQKFLANPDRYSPMLSGFDPVVWHHTGRLTPGRREFGATYGDRVFLFADESSYQAFYRQPEVYIGRVEQAMQATDRIRR